MESYFSFISDVDIAYLKQQVFYCFFLLHYTKLSLVEMHCIGSNYIYHFCLSYLVRALFERKEYVFSVIWSLMLLYLFWYGLVVGTLRNCSP